MLKGKPLYKAARELVDEKILPMLEEERSADEEDAEAEEIKDQAVELGVALAIDIAESLHRISVKVG